MNESKYGKFIVDELKVPESKKKIAGEYSKYAKRILWLDNEVVENSFHMNTASYLKAAATLENVRTGVPSAWVNPDTGYEYTVTPTRTYEASGGPCREFRLDAEVGSSPNEEVYGTACLQADGSWLIQ